MKSNNRSGSSREKDRRKEKQILNYPGAWTNKIFSQKMCFPASLKLLICFKYYFISSHKRDGKEKTRENEKKMYLSSVFFFKSVKLKNKNSMKYSGMS